MDPEIASYAIEFMKRVQLQGAEVPAFSAVVAALHAIATPEPGEAEETP